MDASSSHGTGAQNLANALRSGCADVSGIRLRPSFSRRARASSPVSPIEAMLRVGLAVLLSDEAATMLLVLTIDRRCR